MTRSLADVRHVFLDMDGTIYHGSELFPTTIPFLDFLKSRGIGYTFLSNNSSYGPDDYMDRLLEFGIVTGPQNFYISTDYAVAYIKKHHPEIKRIYPLGMPCMVIAFETAGFSLDDVNPQAVIVGFDKTLTYERLCLAAYFIRNGVPGFATHPDVYCPTDKPTWLVDCGAITACLETATNKKLTVLGKPDPGMLVEAAARGNVPVSQVLMIGDRLSTDVAIGVNAGAVTCHIATPGADLVVPENVSADYDVKDLGELQKIWQSQL